MGGRRLFIDENLNPRIAAHLRKRGRHESKAIARTPYIGFTDPELLKAITAEDAEAVLVTGDDNMPAAHATVLIETGLTLAIVDPEHPPEYSDDEWAFEVVHRWAHRMEAQAHGSIRRYTLAGARVWRPRRRPPRR